MSALLYPIAIYLTASLAVAAPLNPPLPRPRPVVPAPPAARALAPDSDPDCAERLASIATFQSASPIRGPGACEAENVVRLVSVSTSDAGIIKVSPPAVLRCGMAERLAYWLRLMSEPARQESGHALTGISIATSFDCRGQNRDPNAKLSQHGLANAVDVQSLMLTGGRTLHLTDATAPVQLREWLRESACRRFTTVLGPGSDGYHEDHVHLDFAERRGGYRICQWDVRESAK